MENTKKINNQQLLELWHNGYKEIPLSHIRKLEQDAINRIKSISTKYNNICLGFSTGKDCIVVRDLLDKAGVEYIPVLWYTPFQFKNDLLWLECNQPQKLKKIVIPKPNWVDLESNNDLLFVKSKEAEYKWMQEKWKAQKKYLTQNGIDLFVTGRRIKEHNCCGSKSSGYVRKSKAYDTFSPHSRVGIRGCNCVFEI